MAGPVIAATLTRIAAFSPLLFWPGIVGDFMKYLPITLIVTLAASMAYALIFAPTIGALFAKAPAHEEHTSDGVYMAIVNKAVHYPITALVLTVRCSAAACTPMSSTAMASSSSRMSSRTTACSTCMRAATSRWTRWTARRARPSAACSAGRASSRSIPASARRAAAAPIPEDVVGVIQYEFIDWRERKPANQILDDLRVAMAAFPASMSKCACRTPARRPASHPGPACPRRPDRAERQSARGGGGGRQGSRRHRHFRRPAAARH
jgi:multidrug efflux pump